MRSAAKPAQSASSFAMTSNMPASCSALGRATTAARWARTSTSPLAASRRIASRTGVRETSKRRASVVSSSAAPGTSAPRTISSASCRRNSSARVLRGQAISCVTPAGAIMLMRKSHPGQITFRSKRRMRNRRQQIAGIARFRGLHDALGRSLFDDLTRLHDDDTIAQKLHHVEVMRDEKITHA